MSGFLFVPQNAEIVRTRDPGLLSECDIVVDVGGEFDPSRHRYDHHQRYNGQIYKEIFIMLLFFLCMFILKPILDTTKHLLHVVSQSPPEPQPPL